MRSVFHIVEPQAEAYGLPLLGTWETKQYNGWNASNMYFEVPYTEHLFSLLPDSCECGRPGGMLTTLSARLHEYEEPRLTSA